MTPSRKLVSGALAVGLVVGAAALYRQQSRRPTAHPEDAVPSDTFVAVDIDMDAVRRSGALAPLFGNDQEQSVTKQCGFDPVERMHEIVFALPEKGEGDFGVAVRADFSVGELLSCATEVLRARGAVVPPDVTVHGSYKVASPRRAASGGPEPGPCLAYRTGGPYLVGACHWLEKMIDSIEHPRPHQGDHASLRRALAGGVTPAPPFVLTATVVLPESVRDKVKAQMADEVADGGSRAGTMMAGVLGISSAAVGFYEHDDQVRAVADLVCEGSAACSSVARFVWRKQEIGASDPKLRMLGVAAVLEHLEVDHHDSQLQLRASAPTRLVVGWGRAVLDGISPVSPPQARPPP